MTPDEEAEIWRRRKERAKRWRREDGSLAPGYPICRLEEETEETLSAMPPESEKIRKKREGEG